MISNDLMAERVGFEPTCPFGARRFRGAPVTTTSVPLRRGRSTSHCGVKTRATKAHQIRHDRRMASRTLVVGLDDALPPPMQTGSPETGDFHGFEVDLLNEIARRLDARLTWRRSPWSQIVLELETGTIDLICSAATISEARRQSSDFTRPYLQISLAAVSRAGTGPAATRDDGRIGVRRATTAADYLQRKGRQPVLVRIERRALRCACPS